MSFILHISKRFLSCPIVGIIILFSVSAAHGQIYVANGSDGTVGEYDFNGNLVKSNVATGINPYPGNSLEISGSDIYVANSNGTISRYPLATGTASNPLISGIYPLGMTVAGSTLYVTNGANATDNNTYPLQVYNTSGTLLNSSLIDGPDGISGIAVAGSHLYVASTYNGTIGEYNTDGTTVNASLISGLGSPTAIAISGQDIYVANRDAGTVGEYTLDGVPVNTSLLSGLVHPTGIAISGNSLYVTSYGTVGQYSLSGVHINAALITDENNPGLQSIAIGQEVPANDPTTTHTDVNVGSSYAAVTPVTSTGGLGTVTSLVGGSASADKTVTLSTTNLATQFKSLASDVVSVTGNAGDVFALQLTFDLNAANQIGGADAARLLWLNPGTGYWTNAVNGNIGTNTTNPLYRNYSGSFADFELQYGVNDSNLSNYLGAYGVDAVGDTVWAVIDHNSNFVTGDPSLLPQAVPEPGPMALLMICGATVLLLRRAKRPHGDTL